MFITNCAGPLTRSLIFLIPILLLGCEKKPNDVAKIIPRKFDKHWTLSKFHIDIARTTIESPDGIRFHEYYRGAELKRNNETIRLVYKEIPDHLNFETGGKYDLKGLETAKYSDAWDGYWLHDVELKRLRQSAPD